ncbi:rhodanese-like domain-containing protein [Streptomyces chiangmaiensis]
MHGGSLLYGTTGRTDLMGVQSTGPLVHQQYRSVRRLAELLPDDTVVLPTHGFGSFCAATTAGAVQRSTIGRERRLNPVFSQAEEAFATGTLAALEPYPAYYHRMASINAAGPSPRDSLAPPRPADPAELADRIMAGEWVVDVRPRADYASVHLPGTVNIDASGSLATYLGWLVPFDSPLTLLATGHDELEAVRTELLRIGFDRIAAAAVGSPLEWAGPQRLAAYPRADFATLARVRPGRPVEVLDVRGGREWRSGHLPGARHVPLPELPHAVTSLPDAEYWVHCRSGFRAAIAASLLAAAGHQVVLVDDAVENAGPKVGEQ